MKHSLHLLGIAMAALLLWGCSASRHVPQGKFLLDKVDVAVLNDSTGILKEEELVNYLRQQPNHKILWTTKLQLGVYNMSGRDTTKWWNRWIRKMGEAPVVFDSALTAQSAAQLRQAMVNKGFLNAEVEVDTIFNLPKRKAEVDYRLYPGNPHRIASIDYQFANDTLRELVMADSMHFPVRPGDLLDRSRLDIQRDFVTQRLRNHGYYAFTKEYVTFVADTAAGSNDVRLTMKLNPPYANQAGGIDIATHVEYVIRRVRFITGYDAVNMDRVQDIAARDTVDYRDLQIFYTGNHYLRPAVLSENCFLRPGQPYKEANVTRTYEALSRLTILKFANIRFVPAGVTDGIHWLDAYILLTPDKSQSLALELEGTNSEGDLGVAAGITYTHRNIGKGSETFSTKLRGAYESISGNLEGLIHNRYMEYSLESSLLFPKFKFPFLKEGFKRSIRASTKLSANFNYQERPEYTRLIAAASWGYIWKERKTDNRHNFTLLDINYVYLPESTNDFINQIAPDNPLLRYSYEDHFIMSMGYQFYHTNKRRESPGQRNRQRNIYTVRAHAELAGNLLFALSNIFAHRADFRDNPYKVFGIRYSQYFKLEGDYTFTHIFDHRNSVALHAGLGVAYPYGNSTILPFEKRFYGGGANGVRGWDVRTLGPGSFRSTNSVSDFIRQCGDIRLIMSAEYRAKLFWVLELGVFVDAGNIWTIHNYATQPGGMFHFSTFYKQLAAAYGLGIRMDFDYFLIRFDMGMKAHNPAEGAQPWPLIHPSWSRDHSFHFSIGYPF